MEPYQKLHQVLMEHALLLCMDTRDILAFLTSSLIETMERAGYSEEFVQKTLDRMMVKFKEKRKKESI